MCPGGARRRLPVGMDADGTDPGPQIVGIVNITEDSFSDDGLNLAPQDALAHARRLWSEGADIVELGPASSHPDAARVTAATVAKTDPEAVCVSIERFFTDRLSVLQAAGVGRERLIIDPGLDDFLGSHPQPSLTVMAGPHDVSALRDALIVHDAISAETSR